MQPLNGNATAAPPADSMARALDEYLAAAEAGVAPPREEFLARYPELAEDLDACLAALCFIGRAAQGPRSVAAGVADIQMSEPALGLLGDFRLGRELGRGGMGVVYEALQLSLQRRVALKVLPFAAALDPRQLRRFQNEAQAAAGLHHTNIVPVYFVGTERGVHYYAMQYIEGHDLATLIEQLRERRLKEAGSGHRPALAASNPPTVPYAPASEPAAPSASPSAETAALAGTRSATERSWPGAAYARAVARLGIQAAEALEHAHQLGVIHRDIKPANLLLDERDHLWITDFGLAQLQTDSRLTMTGDLLGTLRYMSPEQALAQRVGIDQRTDVYSLGATLYELLTLEPVFPGRDRQELLRQIAFEEPRPLRRLDRAIPAELETIVLKALEKNPVDRYATAQAMADDLGRFLEDLPIRARRPGVGQRLRKWGRRHRGVVATALAVGALALAGLVLNLAWHNRQLSLAAERERDLSTKAQEEAQRAAASATKAQHEQERAEALNRFLLEDLLDEASPEKNPRRKKVTVEEALDKAATKVEKGFLGRPDLEAEVRTAIGHTYVQLGLYDRAQPQVERALALRQEGLGPEHPDTLSAVDNLASLLQNQGKLGEAERLYRQNLEARRRVLGPDHPDTLAAVNNLSVHLHYQGKLVEAEPLSRQYLEARRRVLGPDHPDTLAAVHNLAGLLQDQGKLAEAERLHRQNLEDYRRVLGPDHPDTLGAVHNLAGVLRDQVKLAEAEPLYRQNLEDRRHVLGPDHPGTLSSVNNLATLLINQGKLAEAEPLLRQNLEAYRRVLGPDHPDTLNAVQNLAFNLHAQRKMTEAETLHRQNLEDCIRSLAPDYPLRLEAMNCLAQVLLEQGKLAEAERIARQSVVDHRQFRGADHARTLRATNRLAALLLMQGKQAEAEPLMRQNLEARRRVLGPDHPDTLASMEELADTFHALGRDAEALKLLEEALPLMKAKLGPDHPGTLQAMDLLAVTYAALGRRADALKLLEEILKLRGTKPGQGRQVANRVYNTACIHALLIPHSPERAAQGDQAMEWLRRAVAAGFKDVATMKKDKDLDALRGRADFQQLLNELAAGKPEEPK